MTTSFDAMPLGMYCRILDVLEDKDRDDCTTQVGLIAALCDCPEQKVLDLPVPEFSALAHQLAFLETPPPQAGTLPARLTLNGKEYDVCTDPEKVNTAQYVDYQSLIQQGRAGWPGLVALCIIPVGKAYGHSGPGDPLGYDIAQVKADIAAFMPVAQANAVMANFLRRHLQLTRTSLMSLQAEVRRMPKGEKRAKAEVQLLEARAALEQMTGSLLPSVGLMR